MNAKQLRKRRFPSAEAEYNILMDETQLVKFGSMY